jgi:hypothetical protein
MRSLWPRRFTAAEVAAALVAAVAIALLGTGLGFAAVRGQHDPAPTPLKIVHPDDDARFLQRGHLREIVP